MNERKLISTISYRAQLVEYTPSKCQKKMISKDYSSKTHHRAKDKGTCCFFKMSEIHFTVLMISHAHFMFNQGTTNIFSKK